MAHLHLVVVTVVASVVGCAQPSRVAECDELVGLVDALAKCPKLPESSRAKIAAVHGKLDDMLSQLDRAGGIGKAPQAMQDSLRKTCRTQHDDVALSYAQYAPACVK